MARFVVSALAVACLLVPVWTHAAEHEDQNAEAQKPFVAEVGEDGVQRVEIIGGDYFFKPDHIVVKAGIPVELTFKKEPGFKPHNIKMNAPEAGIQFDVDMDDEKWQTVRFVPQKPGTYAMFCDKRFLFFESHREKGMEGVIEVVE